MIKNITSILNNSVVQKELVKHSATVIFCHGLGDTGDGWSDVTEMIQRRGLEHVKFILPNAPIQPVTINNGMSMNSWYDIKSLTDRGDENKSQVDSSKDIIEAIIKNEVENGIPSERIVISGFSQGAALSLYTFYQTEYKLAGCMALSGYLPLLPVFSTLMTPVNKQQPLIMFHGEIDQVVRHSWGKKSFDTLKSNGINGEFISFPYLQHGACEEEIEKMTEFLKKRLPKQ
eukprot:gene2430-3000_t